jgi:uncharacterized membrane protein SirB2
MVSRARLPFQLKLRVLQKTMAIQATIVAAQKSLDCKKGRNTFRPKNFFTLAGYVFYLIKEVACLKFNFLGFPKISVF